MGESNETEIIVNAPEKRGHSAGDIIRVGGATLLNPAAVAGQIIRNKRLEDAGDDLGGEKPTIGNFVRTAEAIGDGLNDRRQSEQSLSNKPSAAQAVAASIISSTPASGIVGEVLDVVKNREELGHKIGDAVLGIAEHAPIIGSAVSPIAGFLRGNTDVREVERGIKFLSQNNIPGFQYNETKIDGHTVRVYVAAADTMTNGNAKPWVHIDADGINKNDPRVQARAEAVVGLAYDTIDKFITDQTDRDRSDFDTVLRERIHDVVAQNGVTAAPTQSGKILNANTGVNAMSAVADLIPKL